MDVSNPSTWPACDWIRIGGGCAFSCERCGDAYSMALPCPINVMIAAGGAFIAEHRDCLPSAAETGTKSSEPKSTKSADRLRGRTK
jgi:hypothetical protein